MSQTLYLECFSGISGDMTVAALLDLGVDRKVLTKALDSLPVNGYKIEISRVKKSGLDCCDFNVVLEESLENHDHDMEYLHGSKQHSDEHEYEETHAHNHETVSAGTHKHDIEHHMHEHEHQHSHLGVSHHEHRSLPDIMDIINQAAISNRAKELAGRMFQIIAKAEAKAHGIDMHKVHFHEVGAIDSIIDIIAVAVCLDNLNITQVIVPELYEGKGFVRCQHGMIPIPVPAVSNIAMEHGLILHITNVEGELVTPTGAAIVAAMITSSQLPETFTVKKAGLGAGKRNYERPSILRALLIEESKRKKECFDTDMIYKLETNIDDCTGENLGFVMEKLMEAGAKDVNYSPVYMKKNRPAYQLNIICQEEDMSKLEQIVFEETTTIGIRRLKMERTVLKRELQTIETKLGKVSVKICKLPNGLRIYPEYSSVIQLCERHNMPYQEAYQYALEECAKLSIR